MKAVIGYVAFAVLAYIVFLTVTFPADRAYALLQNRMPRGVHLYDVHGSVWDGGAGVAQIGRYRLAPLHWEYRPAGLLSGRVDVKFSFDAGPNHASAVVGVYRDGDIRLSHVRVHTPAAELVKALRLPIVQVKGDFSARLAALTVENHRLQSLVGTVTWAGAEVTRPRSYVLGGLEADFKTEGGVVKGTLHDKGGPLQLQGLVTVKPDGSYQVNADLKNRDPHQADLTRILRRIGRPGPRGEVTVNYSGKMPALPVGL